MCSPFSSATAALVTSTGAHVAGMPHPSPMTPARYDAAKRAEAAAAGRPIRPAAGSAHSLETRPP